MLTQEYVNHLFAVSGSDLVWKNPKARRVKPMDKAGTHSKDGYVRVFIDGKSYLAHRIVYLMNTGSYPKELDHINRIKTDNSFENLRSVSRVENAQNKGAYRSNSTGYRNVHLHSNGRYEAGIRVNGKRIYLGLFDTPEQASQAAELAKTKLFKAELDTVKAELATLKGAQA